MKRTFLNFYGIRLTIHSTKKLAKRLASEFNYFLSDDSSSPAFIISVKLGSGRPAHWTPLIKTKWSTIYVSRKGERRVCFFNKAFVAYRFERGSCDIISLDDENAFEVAYLVILSYIGEELDRRGLHRVHGFGLCRNGRGILFLGTSGVGKSSLAMEFLKEESSRILSDDTPLLEETGGMHAFPQRIALKEKPQLPDHLFRTFKRIQFSEKYVIGSEYFKDRVQSRVLTDAIVLLNRDGSVIPRLRELSRTQLFMCLLKWLVVGHETPQIWQLYLRFSPLSVWWKSRILMSRLRCAWSISKRSRPWQVTLGDSAVQSANQLKTWINDGTLATRIPGAIQ